MRPGARLAPSDGPSLSAALQSTAPSRIERAPAVASTRTCTIRSTSLAPLPTRESSFASASPLRKDAIAINSINAESSARRRRMRPGIMDHASCSRMSTPQRSRNARSRRLRRRPLMPRTDGTSCSSRDRWIPRPRCCAAPATRTRSGVDASGARSGEVPTEVAPSSAAAARRYRSMWRAGRAHTEQSNSATMEARSVGSFKHIPSCWGPRPGRRAMSERAP